MGSWRKYLRAMVRDTNPSGYTYDECAVVLSHLGFECAPHGGGSHRRWRRRNDEGNLIVVGLVDHGAGTLRAVYVRDMIATLQSNGFLPTDPDDALD